MGELAEEEIKVKASGTTYSVLIRENLLDSIGTLLRSRLPSSKAMLVTDTTVYSLYAEKVLRSLASEGWQVTVARIRPGERAKTMAGAMRLYDRAVEAGLDRNSPVIALGGGVVGDLAGFVAATYMRGVPLIMLPTSLLSQVDSSVGGKVAVNHPRGKNLIGSFYSPRLVAIDPLVLKTLSDRQLKAGLAEVVKYGIIMNGEFFRWLEKNINGLLNGDPEQLAEAVAVSVRAKSAVVEEDEYENDYRRILNYGHTVGHALEAATSYRYYLHGEAVIAGMAVAAGIACELGLLEKTSCDRMLRLFDKIGIKKPPADLTATDVMDKLRQDKKRKNNDLIFILPSGLGMVEVLPVNDPSLIKRNLISRLGMA